MTSEFRISIMFATPYLETVCLTEFLFMIMTYLCARLHPFNLSASLVIATKPNPTKTFLEAVVLIKFAKLF
jgi:hypothetical protein